MPKDFQNPKYVGNLEVGVDVRACVEEVTCIIVGCTSSKEQGESRKSTEEAHIAGESSKWVVQKGA